MKPENEEKVTGLPENAYRELKEGESYKPLMSPNKHYPEVTPWSVLWGLVMAVIFSAAAAYLGLKVGQVFEAAIPIAIIAVGLSSGFKRKNALGMFIPLDLNTPLLIGGAISWYVGSRSKDQSLNSARLEKGTLLASGFIAGGALMGVVSAALRFGGINLMNEEWASSNAAEILAVVMYLVMIAYLTFNSLNAKKE